MNSEASKSATTKGLYSYWGWNFSWYQNQNSFKGDNYDFTIHDALHKIDKLN